MSENPVSDRLIALDWMRGLVMALMAIDHAGLVDAGHLFTDGWTLYTPGMLLPVGHFFTRWITHLCAPTFLFLAGVSLALSLEKRRSAGVSARELDIHLLKRGLILIAFDTFFIDPLGQQVLYALGMGFLAMIPLRRLGNRTLILIGVAIIAGSEALVNLGFALTQTDPAVLKTIVYDMMNMGGPDMEKLEALRSLQSSVGWFALFVPLFYPGIFVWLGPAPIFVIYPFVPWLAMMTLGWGFGRLLIRHRTQPGAARPPERLLLPLGLIALAIFAMIRGLNGYGNMGLLREDSTLIQWLHVSKYPPSLAFTALELGLMALCLYGFFRYQRMMKSPPRLWNPLLVFGQTALFLYLLHLPFLGISAGILGAFGKLGLGGTYVFTVGVLIVMYPLCVRYRRYKRAHPEKWTRYI